MKLIEVRIQNFKSIEDAVVEDIGDIDVFCGKNNSGKTSILEAINVLKMCSIHHEIQFQTLSKSLFSGENLKKKMSITLVFELGAEERREWVLNCFSQVPESRLKTILESKFLEKVEYCFNSFGDSTFFGLSQIRFTGTDNKFGLMQRTIQDRTKMQITDFDYFLNNNQQMTGDSLTSSSKKNTNMKTDFELVNRPFVAFQNWIDRLYFFSSFRHSNRNLEAKITENLAADGSNLVQRIFTMKANEDENWEKLQGFVENALPDVGDLQSRINSQNRTDTVFVDRKWNIEIDIHDMGSGIEQLLMIACVLIPETRGSLIMIEAPEHHLHPGAQRTLLGFLKENLKSNQVLITTHSPVFLSQKEITTHIVTKKSSGTKIQKVEESDDLSLALTELGSKNSDILLADMVLFVEGDSDEIIIKTWAKKLGVDFDAKNILCLRIGGCRNLDYYANSDILQRISKLKIPYVFILDRDEKSETTLTKIQAQIQNVCILERREIENYLLDAECILEAMRIKAKDNKVANEQLAQTKPDEIERCVINHASGFKNLVLLKRIRTEMGGITFLSDEGLNQLMKDTEGLELTGIVDKICQVVDADVKDKCGKARTMSIAEKQFLELNEVWAEKNEEKIKKIAPGEEILKATFKTYGLKYDKSKDGMRIAQQMKINQIPSEIRTAIDGLIKQEVDMGGPNFALRNT